MDKEDVALLTSGADSQHFRKKLIWLLSFQGRHLLNKLNLLVVGELMSRQKPGPQLRIGVSRQWRLPEVGHKVDGGLRQGGEHVVVADELIVGAMQDELPLGHGEPGDDVVGPEERQLDVLVVHRRRRWWRRVLSESSILL